MNTVALIHKYFFIYDSSVWQYRFLAFLLRLLTEPELNFMTLDECAASFQKEDRDKLLAHHKLLFMVDFNIDREFEALDENFIPSISDKRIYSGKVAIEKCLLFNSWFRKF
jgi:hypothetical protein